MDKLKKLIDEAFKQSLQMVCEFYGVELEHLNILVQFIGSQVVLIACNENKVVGRFPIPFLLGTKLLGLRYDAKKVRGIFKALQFTFTTAETLNDADDVSLILYNSKKVEKPCVSVLIKNEPQKTLAISNVVEALELGVEQHN